jgi:gas vesicle protein
MAQDDIGTNLTWFLGGLLLGASAALLLAPETGKRTRGKIASHAKEGRKALSESGREIFERGRDLYERGRELAEDAADMFEQGRKLAEKKINDI